MPFTTSPTEKLIILLLCDAIEKKEAGSYIDPKVIRRALEGRMSWGIEWKFAALVSPDIPEETGEEVRSLLEMWSHLTAAYNELAVGEQKRAREASPFDSGVTFPGFDHNNHSDHLAAMRFIVEDLGQWQEFQGRDTDTHSQTTLFLLRGMFETFKRLRRAGQRLRGDEIIEILTSEAITL